MIVSLCLARKDMGTTSRTCPPFARHFVTLSLCENWGLLNVINAFKPETTVSLQMIPSCNSRHVSPLVMPGSAPRSLWDTVCEDLPSWNWPIFSRRFLLHGRQLLFVRSKLCCRSSNSEKCWTRNFLQKFFGRNLSSPNLMIKQNKQQLPK